jgi:hypothetical protein
LRLRDIPQELTVVGKEKGNDSKGRPIAI